MSVAGHYFDGISARRHKVTLSICEGQLQLHGEQVERTAGPGQFTLPGRLGSTPRLILFPDGARCEVADHAGFDELLRDAGIASQLIGHLESRWHYAMAALAATLALVAAAYVWGLPYVAGQVASRLPERILSTMDRQFMQAFDGRLLKPSTLSPLRQQALASRVQRLRLPGEAGRPAQLLFRSSPAIGPNAFALPGGTVVVLDELVALSTDDDEIVAVLAHEMGHVAGRHPLRQTLQASVVGLAMAWYVGDVSSVLAVAPATLLETRYSRDFERRADAFGATVLEMNGIAGSRLADILEKLERVHGGHGAGTPDDGMDYLSTHPNTAARIRALRGPG